MVAGKQARFGAGTEVEIPVVYKFFRKDKTVSWAQTQETSSFLYYLLYKAKIVVWCSKTSSLCTKYAM